MKTYQPLVLLFAGLISISGIGCAGVNAVITKIRPPARQNRGTAERMVAIARIYENRGNYEQAEVMYRKALRENPGDAAIQSSLRQLADRRSGVKSGPDQDESKVAKTDASPSQERELASHTDPAQHKPPVLAAKQSPSTASSLTTTAETIVTSESMVTARKLDPGEQIVTSDPVRTILRRPAELSDHATADEVEIRVGDASPLEPGTLPTQTYQNQVRHASAVVENLPSKSFTGVTSEEILAVIDAPADHADLLLNGLEHGDSVETQCLAATLLGDCDFDDESVREALVSATHSAKDYHLRLAICDSRIQRHEEDDMIADCLIELIESAPTGLRLQACSILHYFAGTASAEACVTTLEKTLDDNLPELRASAAITLGDFTDLSRGTVARLDAIGRNDEAAEVREAALLAFSRCNYAVEDASDEILVIPLGK